jgi:hypothetical protein
MTLTISRKKRHLQLTDTNTQVFPINGTPLRKGNLDGLREKQKLNLANAGVGAIPHSKGTDWDREYSKRACTGKASSSELGDLGWTAWDGPNDFLLLGYGASLR